VIDNLLATGTMHLDLCRFVIGQVEQTLSEPQNRPKRIALLRLDTDYYSSTLTELEQLYPLLSPGGILIVDDYGHWIGARRAVDEFFAGAMPAFTMVDYSGLLLTKV
jgi:O-methyltransferase